MKTVIEETNATTCPDLRDKGQFGNYFIMTNEQQKESRITDSPNCTSYCGGRGDCTTGKGRCRGKVSHEGGAITAPHSFRTPC